MGCCFIHKTGTVKNATHLKGYANRGHFEQPQAYTAQQKGGSDHVSDPTMIPPLHHEAHTPAPTEKGKERELYHPFPNPTKFQGQKGGSWP